jgi:hypothetical protein
MLDNYEFGHPYCGVHSGPLKILKDISPLKNKLQAQFLQFYIFKTVSNQIKSQESHWNTAAGQRQQGRVTDETADTARNQIFD